MNEFEQTEQIEEAGKTKQKHRKSKLVRQVHRVLAFAVTIALIIGAVFVITHWDQLNANSIKQWLSYHALSAGANQQAEDYTFHGDADSSIAMVDGYLVVCTSSELQIYQRNADTAVSQAVNMNKPVINTSGNYAVAYDAGGTELYLIYRNQVSQTFTADDGQEIISARVSSNGSVTMVQKATGYKASTTVYNSSFKALVTENISSSFTMDAALSPDGKTLAVVSVGEDSTGFDSVVIFYNVSDGQEKGRCAIGSDVILDMNWTNSGLWCAGGYGTYLMQDCSMVTSYVDSTRYLQNFSLGGTGYAVLLFNKYQGSSAGSLTVLDATGTELSVGINEEILSVSASGDYIAVLTANTLTIYKESGMSVYAGTTNTTGARRVLMQSDGSALMIATGTAKLFTAQTQ